MDLESSRYLMMNIMKDISKIIISKATVHITFQMEINMKDNGKQIRRKEAVYTYLRLQINKQ